MGKRINGLGRLLKKYNLKNVAVYMLALVLLPALLSGCGSSSKKTDESEAEYETICEEYKDVTPKHVFIYAENQAKDYPTSLGAFRFAYLVHERTEGKIQIRVYVDGELGNEQDLVKKLCRGGLDFMRASMTGITDYSAKSQVLVMPYLYNDAEHMWNVLDGDIGQEILDSFDGTGMKALSWYDAGVRNFYSSEPIETIDDLKGKVIRVQASDIMYDIIKCLGAQPYATEYDEVYSALQTGTVDIAENNWSSYESMEHYKVAPYYMLDEHVRVPEIQLMSQNTYDILTDEEKSIIEECARESALYERELWKTREEYSEEKVVAEGCQVITISNSEKEKFKEAVKPVYEKYCSDYMDLIERIWLEDGEKKLIPNN